jgi:hypothetical protein
MGILLVFAVVCSPLTFYEDYLIYYDEGKADRIVMISLGMIYLLYFMVDYIYSKELHIIGFAVLSIVSGILIVPIFSGLLLFINAKFGPQKSIQIVGKVTEVIKSQSQGSFECELIIKTSNNDTYQFDASYYVVKHYKVGDDFNRKIKKGCLGILYY